MYEGARLTEPKQGRVGTTTVGLVCSDGVVLAADKRATMGYFIASKDVEKIFKVDDRLSMTVAGSVADAQTLVRWVKAEAKLYKLRERKRITVEAAGTLLSNVMFQYKMIPFYVQLLVAGVEREPRIICLDPLGGATEEKFVSTGSGSPIAYGLLEASYVKDKPVKENLRLAIKALTVAIKRDCASGENIDLVAITKAGFKRYKKEEVEKLMEEE